MRAKREGEFELYLYGCKQLLRLELCKGWSSLHLLVWKNVVGIEPTYIKISKEPLGLIRTNTLSVQNWINVYQLCSEVSSELESLKNNGGNKNKEKRKTFKEKGKGRIQSNAKDRRKLQLALKNCFHRLETESQISGRLANIYTNEKTVDNVNINKAKETGNQKLIQF